MKKTCILTLSLFCLLTMVIVSCGSDNTKQGLASSPGSEPVPVKSDTANWSSLGSQHNRGLEYFLHNADKRNAKDQVYSLTTAFEIKEGYDEAVIKTTLNNKQVAAVIGSRDTGPLREYLSSALPAGNGYLDKIFGAINASPDAPSAIISLATIENDIRTDSALPGRYKTAFLQGIAIGKNSLDYWYTQSRLGVKSPWVKWPGVSKPGSFKINWKKVAAQDLAGGIVGGLFGGVGGAAAGAVGASVGEIVGEIF